MDNIFELWGLFKLPLDKQNEIIKDLIASDLSISQENVTKLNAEIQVGRINYHIENAIKKATVKPKKVLKRKKVVEESEEDKEIFHLEI